MRSLVLGHFLTLQVSNLIFTTLEIIDDLFKTPIILFFSPGWHADLGVWIGARDQVSISQRLYEKYFVRKPFGQFFFTFFLANGNYQKSCS